MCMYKGNLAVKGRPYFHLFPIWEHNISFQEITNEYVNYGIAMTPCTNIISPFSGTRGESGGQTGITYDISNKHRLGYSEVQLVQKMIDGVNTLVKEDRELQKKYKM